jgi:hypothetical protein
LSCLIAKLTKENQISSIIDLGAGQVCNIFALDSLFCTRLYTFYSFIQGYLSRVLAYTYNLCVFAIDASNIQTCGAQKYQFRTEKSLGFLRKGKNEIEGHMKSDELVREKKGGLTHVTQHVTSETLTNLISKWNMNKEQFNVGEVGDCEFNKVNNDDKDIVDESCSVKQLKQDYNLLICGLHSCGELSSTMLDLFIKNEEIKCVVNVGCCYHLLHENKISKQEDSKGINYDFLLY